MKKLLLLLALIPALAQALSLQWDPVTEAAGYNVYCGETPDPDPIAIDAGNVTILPMTLTEGVEYECWVTAYAGTLESGHSNHIVFTVPSAPQTLVLPSAPGSITITW